MWSQSVVVFLDANQEVVIMLLKLFDKCRQFTLAYPFTNTWIYEPQVWQKIHCLHKLSLTFRYLMSQMLLGAIQTWYMHPTDTKWLSVNELQRRLPTSEPMPTTNSFDFSGAEIVAIICWELTLNKWRHLFSSFSLTYSLFVVFSCCKRKWRALETEVQSVRLKEEQ